MPSTVRLRLDRHLIAAQAVFFRTIAGGSFEIMPNWGRGYSGLEIPTWNIFIPRKSAGLNDDTLADTAAFFFSHNVLYAVELVHDLFPTGPNFLNKRRYDSLPPQPAMVFELPAHQNYPFESSIQVERVATVPALTAFCTLQHRVFDFALEDMQKCFSVLQFKEEKIDHYLAFVDEQPVGAGTLVCHDNVASIWNVGTTDHYRGRGVATQLLQHMLAEAAHRDCTLVTTYSTAQAYKLFSNCGFEIYTQRQWFLPPGIDYGDEDEKS